MRRTIAIAALLLMVFATPAAAKTVGLPAPPNPARVGERVVYTVDVAVTARLEVWVSARGFAQPRMGTLPSGAWVYECCPSQSAGTPAWHYRSSTVAAAGARYRLPEPTPSSSGPTCRRRTRVGPWPRCGSRSAEEP